MGVCGKSETIYKIQKTLSCHGVKNFTTSTTGLTENHIGGKTIHSLLKLPIKILFQVLSGSLLTHLQSFFSVVKV